MPTIIPDQTAPEKLGGDEFEIDAEKKDSADSIPPLGQPREEKKFWFQRGKDYDPNAIATQPSVYDVADVKDQYLPREDWENAHRFDPLARWTWGEEYKVVRRIDWRIMLWVAVMFTAMELDRANLNQAVADNFLDDLNLGTNDYNLGNSVYALSFLAGEFPSQLLAKWVGPDRWIPIQIVLFSIVSASHVSCICRIFYKHHELTIRLSFFWTGMFMADILASIIAFGLLHLRGVQGLPGWRWLFLIEVRGMRKSIKAFLLTEAKGLITGTIGLMSFVMLPPGPTQTASWSRGKKGWFTARIIRDDPSKGTMHNREPITPKLLWKSLTDVDLWPLYAIGLTFNIPTFSPQLYLTLSLKGLGFTTFQTNLLTIPYLVLKIINMLLLSTLAEVTGQLAASASLFQFWCLPFLIYLRVVDTTHASKWLTWAIISLLLAAPLAHPVQVGWISRNANTVRSRAVGAALYNMFLQAGVVISSNIYRADDAPLYRRGNSILLGILSLNIVLYIVAKSYYIWRNRSRARKWDSMTPEERLVYLSDHQDKGNKRLDFRLAS
ncbi:hypothetical protein O1611_g6413 [Lasiodiplodia mahajangana]|uniref:Uncharacterized protein n=1 Tax=Lasiodiplodia mahajangana TaxID=1108764 RepID=A0ACC2JIN5_9PEZI|nr:hypothetical protein O1611_g6413 [Lasiodiplodia mahajangana]